MYLAFCVLYVAALDDEQMWRANAVLVLELVVLLLLMLKLKMEVLLIRAECRCRCTKPSPLTRMEDPHELTGRRGKK